mmetsp:Transcript_48891/g.76260  ORF Transcript_48891/g.76260 Transcript_48891/m.76260 type:complete len:83 (+) Transcript_48891:3-251(+)
MQCRESGLYQDQASILAAKRQLAIVQASLLSSIVNEEKGAEVCMADDDSDHEATSPNAQSDWWDNEVDWTKINKDAPTSPAS